MPTNTNLTLAGGWNPGGSGNIDPYAQPGANVYNPLGNPAAQGPSGPTGPAPVPGQQNTTFGNMGSGSSFGGNLLNGPNDMQSMSGAGGTSGVAPGTPTTQSGWQYGTGQPGTAVNTHYIDPAHMPNTSVGTGENYQQTMQDAYYQQAQGRLDPQFQAQQSEMENRLANQGITRGSEAWNNEMDAFNRSRTDAYGRARNEAIMASGAEAARRQGMDIAAGNFGNQAVQQNYQNELTSQGAQNAAQGQAFGEQSQDAATRNAAMAAQGGLANQRYGIDVGARTALGTASIGASASTANAGAARDAQLQADAWRRQLAEQGQAWDQFRSGLFLPYELQNYQMNGMYPTGMPNAPSYTAAAGQPQGNYATTGGAQNASVNNLARNAASFGGNLYNNTYGIGR